MARSTGSSNSGPRWIIAVATCTAGALCWSAGAAADESWRTLTPGLEYRHEHRATGPLSIHVLGLDRRQSWELQTELGQGTVFGLATLPEIAQRASCRNQKPAVAAINGDFFVIKAGAYQGDPCGLHIVQGELTSRPTGNAFWVSTDGELKLGPVESKLRVLWPDGKMETALGLNEARSDDRAVLYTPLLGLPSGETARKQPTTRTSGGKELVLERVAGRAWLPLQAGGRYPARIREIREADSPLRSDRMVLSLGPKLSTSLPRVGDIVQLVMETNPSLEGVKTAIGVRRILLAAGRQPDLGPRNQPRHPRSMIGWNRSRLFLMVVDGRQKGLSVGMTYPEMSALAREYGCTEAAELDGGGSSTLWAMGRVLNSPSDGRPRAIANGLIVFRATAGP